LRLIDNEVDSSAVDLLQRLRYSAAELDNFVRVITPVGTVLTFLRFIENDLPHRRDYLPGKNGSGHVVVLTAYKVDNVGLYRCGGSAGIDDLKCGGLAEPMCVFLKSCFLS